MNVTEALDEAAQAVTTESAQAEALVVLAEAYKAQETTVRRDERETLAAWFETNASLLRDFSGDGFTPEFASFLLRLSHD